MGLHRYFWFLTTVPAGGPAPITATVAESGSKATEAAIGTVAIVSAVAETSSKPIEALTGTCAVVATVADAGSKGTEAIAGTVAIAVAVTETGSKATEAAVGALAVAGTVAESGLKATEAATAAISVAVIAAETGSKGTESIVGTVAIAATIAETGSEPTEAIEVTVVPAGAIVAETGSKPTEAVTGTVAIAGSVTEVGAKSTDAVTVTKALLPTFRSPSGPAISAATLPGAGMIRVSYTSLPELARAVQELAFRLNDAITAAAAASAVPPTDPLPYLTYADGNTVTLEAGDPLLLGAQPTDTEYLGDAQGAPLLLADCRPMRLGASGVAQAEATRINELIRSGLMQWLPPEARRVTSETVDQYKNVPES
jgi:hypothetical protein